MGHSENSRKFEFIREIASGGFGRVYLAKVIHRDGFARLVAIKILHKKWTQNDEIASRMRDEARLLGWLRHKNIVDVMDLTSIDGRCAVIMEYLEAVDLSTIIAACLHSERRLPLRVALETIAAVASALDAAYNRPPYSAEKPLRVIHRDIKPSNVMVDDQGMVKVLDFGVARAEFDHRESKTKDLAFGSMEYMSPERLFFEPETPASDVYSLGVTLYELIALKKFGKAKLRAPAHKNHVDQRLDELEAGYPMPSGEVGREFRTLLASMLSFSQKDRISAADAMTQMRSLARGLRQLGLEEWSPTVIPPLVQQVQRRQKSRDADGRLLGNTVHEDEGTAAFRRAGVEGNPELEIDTVDSLNPPTIPTTLKRSSGGPRMPRGSDLGPPDIFGGENSEAVLPESDAAAEPQVSPAASLAPAASLPPSKQRARPLRKFAVLAGLLTGVLVLFVAAAMVLGAVGFYLVYLDMERQASQVQHTPVVVAAPLIVATGPSAQFISLLPNTKKMSVRCDGGKGSGSMEATVHGTTLGNCTVIALYDGRQRKTVVIKNVKSSRYKCFRDGEQSCVLAAR